MSRRLAAAMAVTAVFASGPASAAESILTQILRDAVEGCYGVAVTVCHPHVSSNPVSYQRQTVPVCAISCEYPSVPVPYNDGDDTCVAWHDEAGNQTERCVFRQRPDTR